MREGVLRPTGLAAAALLGLGVATARAADQPPTVTGPAPAAPAIDPTSVIGGPSTCPRPDAVWAELVTLVPRERLEARLGAVARGKAPVVEIIDLGGRYRILAAGQIRDYQDETHDCAYRARIAAVFVALALDPAELPPPSPPLAAPAPPPVAAPPAPPAAPLPAARLDLGAAVLGGVGPDDRVAEPGIELRWSGGRRAIGPEAGVTALLPVDDTVGGVRLRQWRLPVDAGVRARSAGPRSERYAEVGLAVALVSERALELASPRSQLALELGVRAAVGVHARGRLAPFAALSAELVPFPPAVFALPAGTLGHTPLLWIGATAGASLGFP